jgi:hypothetical protein
VNTQNEIPTGKRGVGRGKLAVHLQYEIGVEFRGGLKLAGSMNGHERGEHFQPFGIRYLHHHRIMRLFTIMETYQSEMCNFLSNRSRVHQGNL